MKVTVFGMQRKADTDGAVVAEITTDLSDEHWYGVGGEFNFLCHIKVINGFDQTDAADLKKIIDIFIAVIETLNDAENQAEISFDICVSCFFITLLYFFEEFIFFIIGE